MTKVTANTEIRVGREVIAQAGQEIAVTFSKDGKSVYIPTAKYGNIVKPACWVTAVAK
jgi:hypothetical protein